MTAPFENWDAECIVVGSPILDPACMERLGDLSPEVFGHPHNAEAWRAIQRVHAKGLPLEIPAIEDELRKTGAPGRAGGTEHLADCVLKVAHTVSVRYYADLLVECGTRRRLRDLADELARRIADPSSTFTDIAAIVDDVTAMDIARLDGVDHWRVQRAVA